MASISPASPKPLSTMLAPAAASPSAMRTPMPLVEPVTRARWLANGLKAADMLRCPLR
jgi:hypothetical protein